MVRKQEIEETEKEDLKDSEKQHPDDRDKKKIFKGWGKKGGREGDRKEVKVRQRRTETVNIKLAGEEVNQRKMKKI